MRTEMSLRTGAAIVALFASGIPGIARGQQVRELFERTSRSVVVVRTLEKALAPDPRAGFVMAGGQGSGTVISAEGRILTAAHVVQTADRVGVELQDGRLFTASVVASSPRADVALLQLDNPPPDLVPARLGDSDQLRTGDQVIVVGAPYGLSYTLTVGHLSGRLKAMGTIGGVTMEFLQTDAAINQGNSGGPMFNLAGEVVGVVSHILSKSGGFEGLGFAVPANVAEKLLLSSRSFWTGVEGFLLAGDMARLLNLPQPAGLLIERVAASSPGAALGLQPGTVPVRIQDEELILGGDIVLEVGGIPVTAEPEAEDQAERYLRTLEAGAPIRVKVLRGGLVFTLTATRPR